jgi:glutamyl-tRNA reductase
MLLVVGCSFRNTPVEIRERLAFAPSRLPAALEELNSRYDVEAVILSTCNRVELYLGRAGSGAVPPPELVAEFLGQFHDLPRESLGSHLYQYQNDDAVRHLFRVIAGLDSLVLGECQIAGQVKGAYELGQQFATVGPLLHALFQHARRVAARVRAETGLAEGHVSVSSAAVDYVRQVFEHFADKTILVIGAGKMGELTLQHLRRLAPLQVLVANRSPDKAAHLADACSGSAVDWDELDDALAAADIVLSTTGAPQPLITLERYERIRARRGRRPMVILDIAVPRDFDPRIHDGDCTCLFNIDDLKQIRERTLRDRQGHVGHAEAIIDHEVRRFLGDWKRRSHGGAIARITEDFEAKRQAVVHRLLSRLNGRLTEADQRYIEGAFRLLQNQFLHGPISALAAEPAEGGVHTLLEAVRKLFRIEDS